MSAIHRPFRYKIVSEGNVYLGSADTLSEAVEEAIYAMSLFREDTYVYDELLEDTHNDCVYIAEYKGDFV